MSWFETLENFFTEELNTEAKEFFNKADNSGRVFNLDESGFPLAGTGKLGYYQFIIVHILVIKFIANCLFSIIYWNYIIIFRRWCKAKSPF